MLKDIHFHKIYIACGRTDLRKGIDGLATIVKEEFGFSPFQVDTVFLFCGTRSDRIKALCWEGDGFVLLYKRIEAGRLRWPRNREEVCEISQEDLQLLLSGFTILEEPSVRRASYSDIA